ncbi:MAG: hypothetical protein R3E40_05525 [Rhodocyclaceae bacterium]
MPHPSALAAKRLGQPQPVAADIALMQVNQIFLCQFDNPIHVLLRDQACRHGAHRRLAGHLLAAHDLGHDGDQRLAMA